MLNLIPIQSLDAPDLKPYRTLRRAAEHVHQGIFVAEADAPVAVGRGRPGVAVKPVGVPPASSVRAEAV